MISIHKGLYAHFSDFAKECGGQRFVFDEDKSYTVLEAFHEIIAIGNNLHDYGIKKGTLVALRCTRSIDAYFIYLALVFIGATVALTNSHLTIREFMEDIPIDAEYIISDERIQQHDNSSSVEWEIIGHGLLKVCYPGRCETQKFVESNDILAPATIYFTSGSTGKNKGAVANQQAFIQRALDIASQNCYNSDDIAMVVLPIYHAFGHLLVQTAYLARYALFFPRYNDVEYALKCIEKYRVTCMDAVPSYFYSLAQASENKQVDVSSLRMGFTGGAPITQNQHGFIEHSLGMTLYNLYAMSECLSISNTSPEDSPEKRSTTVGRIHRDAGFILDPNGIELPNGEAGEICISGLAVMSGYYGNEEETRLVIDRKGRFHTGDIGYIDHDGYLHISGRIKDIIIRNGINLVPAKIESAIRSVEAVKDVAVIGIQDEKLGEAPVALIVLHSHYKMTADELRAAFLAIMPKNEVPTKIKIVDFIPINHIGKPDKQEIKKMFV